MSKHRHPWYSLPWRAVLLAGTLAASFVRDWLPSRRSRRYRSQPCRDCYHSKMVGGDWFCYQSLGLGYGHEVCPDGHCEQWKPDK